jgi:hypothetical protein
LKIVWRLDSNQRHVAFIEFKSMQLQRVQVHADAISAVEKKQNKNKNKSKFNGGHLLVCVTSNSREPDIHPSHWSIGWCLLILSAAFI